MNKGKQKVFSKRMVFTLYQNTSIIYIAPFVFKF